jgi:hypothetical protein
MNGQREDPPRDRIDPARILGRVNRAPYLLRWLWARGHLLLLCGRCSEGTRRLRDIEYRGECWWWEHWKRGNYDIPFWMGPQEKARLSEVRRECLARGEAFPVISSLDSALCEQWKAFLSRFKRGG